MATANRPESANADGKSKKTPQQPRKIYLFAIGALTLFLLGIMLWRTPIKGYLVGVRFTLTSTDDDAEETNQKIRDEILSPENVRLALKEVGPNPADGSHSDSEEFPSNGDVERMIHELHVVSDEDASSTDSKSLRLLYVGVGRQWSLDLIDQLANQTTENRSSNELSATDRQALDDLENSLVDARRQETEAQQLLDALLKKHFEMLQKRRDPSGSADTRQSADRSSFDTRKPNPEWVQYQQQLTSLLDSRKQMLTKQTQDHPDVLALDEKIQQQRKRIAQTSPYIDSGQSDTTPDLPIDTAPQVIDNPSADTDIATAVADYEKLHSRHAQARQKRLEAEQSLDQVRKMAQTSPAQLPLKIAQQAHVVQRVGGTPPLGRVVFLGVLACMAGGLLVWLASGKAETLLTRPEQIQEELDVPVVAALSVPSGPKLPKQRLGKRKIARWAVTGCEATLAMIVFGVFFLALVDSSMMSEFADDPFATLGQAVQRMTKLPF